MKLQPALDMASLAAATPGKLNDGERAALAEDVFWQNYDKGENITLTVKAKNERVDVSGVLKSDPYFASIFGKKAIETRADSAAIHTRHDVICVLALNPIESETLIFEEGANFNATDCSVQVNSSAKDAMISTADTPPTAKSFCVNGGLRGKFQPYAKAACTAVEDPYKDVKGPAVTRCDYSLSFIWNKKRTLNPGVYCGGINLNNSEVKLNPGTYVMHNGALSIGAGSRLVGEGVTIIFTGWDSTLYAYLGSEMDLTAPTEGPYAGLVFFEDQRRSNGGISIIKGSSDIRLVGTMYFPKQELFVSGTGSMGSQSPAMAFIADKLTFTAGDQDPQSVRDLITTFLVSEYGASNTSGGSVPVPLDPTFHTIINTDHEVAGLPPILPRSDDGALLVR